MPTPDSEAVSEAVAELDRVRAEWMARSGVTGVDVGLLMGERGLTEELGIRVMVRRKLPPEQVPQGELFPRTLGRFPVQVVQSTPEPQ